MLLLLLLSKLDLECPLLSDPLLVLFVGHTVGLGTSYDETLLELLEKVL